MAAALNTLFDKRRMALTKARLRAWWEGEVFDAAAAEAAIDAELSAANENGGDVSDALFDDPEYEMPARLRALELIWGEGRIRPGDGTADALEPARLGLPEDGVLALLGAGLVGPVLAAAGAHPGKIDVFEWREETVDALRAQVRKAKLAGRVTVTRVDLEAHVWQPATFDGVWSIDDFAYAGYPPHLAQQIYKMLKPGGCAVVECYVGVKIPEFATAFASSFAEPQVRAHGDLLQFFGDAGLAVEADEELGDEFLGHAREGFTRLAAVVADASALDATTAREIAWEAEAWKARLRLLVQKRLERRRFVLRKPVDGPALPPEVPEEAAAPQSAENTNEPAG